MFNTGLSCDSLATCLFGIPPLPSLVMPLSFKGLISVHLKIGNSTGEKRCQGRLSVLIQTSESVDSNSFWKAQNLHFC